MRMQTTQLSPRFVTPGPTTDVGCVPRFLSRLGWIRLPMRLHTVHHDHDPTGTTVSGGQTDLSKPPGRSAVDRVVMSWLPWID